MTNNNLDYIQQELDRNTIRDLYDRSAQHGEITGHGPGFQEAMIKFKRRQERLRKVGKWRAVDASWTRDDGDYIDPDYYLVNW